jgi:ribosome modulation factor
MKPIRLLISTLAIALVAGTGSAFAQRYYGPPPMAYAHRDAAEAMEQRGFQDGIVGAEHDYKNHRRPDVNNRDEYRDPGFIPAWGQHEYREGFRRGYYLRVRQVYYGERPDYGWRDGR